MPEFPSDCPAFRHFLAISSYTESNPGIWKCFASHIASCSLRQRSLSYVYIFIEDTHVCALRCHLISPGKPHHQKDFLFLFFGPGVIVEAIRVIGPKVLGPNVPTRASKREKSRSVSAHTKRFLFYPDSVSQKILGKKDRHTKFFFAMYCLCSRPFFAGAENLRFQAWEKSFDDMIF